MRYLVVVGALALTGCAGMRHPDTVEVKVPVAVQCKAPQVDKPAFAVDALPLGASIYSQMKALRAERLQRIAFESELEAGIRAMQQPLP